MTNETDPTGRKANEPGAKLDHGKAPVAQGAIAYFPRALRAVAEVSAVGAAKYTWNGWESVPDGISRYENAMARHQIAASAEAGFENRNVARDKDTGLLHAAHTAWNALAVLELILREDEDAAIELKATHERK
jgi:hypothetical protein